MSRDGGRNYPQRFERELTDQRPPQPAAVLIYGRDGLCRTLCLDFDSSAPAGIDRVQADVRGVTSWLYAHGARWIEDHSPSGGRHVYVPLADPLPFLQARDIVEALARRHRSLDATPHQNLRHGCIRTPGATHKSGGTQELAMSLRMALDVATNRTPAATIAALFESLQPELELVRQAREEKEKKPVTATPTAPGSMSRRILAIATQGVYDTSHYDSPSEARHAVLVAAAGAGLQLTDVQRRIQQGMWPGLAQFYSRYSPANRSRSLRRDWLKASKYADDRKGPVTVHKTNTSQPSTQGGWDRGIQPGTDAEHRFLRSWRNALGMVETRYQATRAGLGRRLVLRALGAAAHMTGSRVVEFGVRSLAVASGIEPTSVAAHLRALRGENDALIRHVGEARGIHGDQYELVIPEHLQLSADAHSWPGGKLYSLRPVFRELGPAAAFVYEVLEHSPTPPPVTDVVRRTGLSRSAVHEALEVLAAWGLCERTPAGWSRRPQTVLGAVAELLGVMEVVVDQVRKYREQRHVWRNWLARRAMWLPELPSPTDDYPWEQFCGPPDDWALSDFAFKHAG